MSQEAFYKACEDGAETEVILAYLKDPHVDPAAEYSRSIFVSASEGHTEVVRVLLADPRVDPSAMSNSTISWAAGGGHVDVVRLLLADPRVDPSGNKNDAVRSAAAYGHVEVLQELLADHRVNALRAIEDADERCVGVLAADERFGIEHHRDLYVRYHPDIVKKHSAAISQSYTLAFVAKQLPTWSDMVEPVAKRLKLGCF